MRFCYQDKRAQKPRHAFHQFSRGAQSTCVNQVDEILQADYHFLEVAGIDAYASKVAICRALAHSCSSSCIAAVASPALKEAAICAGV